MNAKSINGPVLAPDENGVRRLEFKALGTDCLVLFREDDDKNALTFAAEALGWIGAFEAKFSRYRPDSLVSRVNAAAGREWITVDAEMDQLLDLAETLYQVTLGILDATILPLLKVWDWRTTHEKLPSKKEVDAARLLTGWGKIRRKKHSVFLPSSGMGLDFGGFGKEFAVDRITHIALGHDIRDVLVDLGRDVRTCGGNGRQPFWHIGLEDDSAPGTCWGGIAASGFAVCTSGDSARRFTYDGKHYGHVLDPRTGWPVANGVRAVTTLAPTCLQAGVYSTSISILGADEGLDFARCAREVEVCVRGDEGIRLTNGFARRQVEAA